MSNASELFRKRLNALVDADRQIKTRICEKTKITRANLDLYLKGSSVPGLIQAEKIAQAVGFTLGEFIREEGEPVPKATPNAGEALEIIRRELEMPPLFKALEVVRNTLAALESGELEESLQKMIRESSKKRRSR